MTVYKNGKECVCNYTSKLANTQTQLVLRSCDSVFLSFANKFAHKFLHSKNNTSFELNTSRSAKITCWRTRFARLSDRSHSWKNCVHFTTEHDLKSQTFAFERYGVIFEWVQKMLKRTQMLSNAVVNFQSGFVCWWLVLVLKMACRAFESVLESVLRCKVGYLT